MISNHLITKSDFELFYLIELTKQKIKPLSRWEKSLNDKTREYIRKQGLYMDVISRKTLLRYPVYETIFSTSSHYLDFYRKKFNNSSLRRDKDLKLLEGFLFGYPSCCVHQFIKKPYIKNGLSKEDQSMLFHWACQNCRATPELLPYYKSIFDQIHEWYQYETSSNKKNEEIFINNYRRKLQTAIATVLLSAGLLSAQTGTDTTHYIPLPNDIDKNGLSYAEEVYVGAYYYGLEEDCQTYAILFNTIIDNLPNTSQPDITFKIEHRLRGIVFCPKCGEPINMGYVNIVNPLRNLKMNIPFLGLHFMENGYFSYGSDEAYQRVDIDTLKRILYPFDQAHMLPVVGDSDGDGLTDTEEDSLLMNPGNPDHDSDGVPDGAQIAEELIRLFPKLKDDIDKIHSYIEFYPTWGSESCQICGSIHNMGFIKIINPENNRSCEIPFVNLHSLAHGSFAYHGTIHPNGRTSAIELYRVMKTHMVIISEDSDNDGLKDNEEEYFRFDPNMADSNGDGICDGAELALTAADTIKSLPTEPSTTEPYVRHYYTNGHYNCPLCGEPVNMGFMELYNPILNTPYPLNITYYAFHFMEKGSFAYDGLFEGRIDPIQLSNYLNNVIVDIDPGQKNNISKYFILEQNYPNPFNPNTEINFTINKGSDVTINIYDLQGKFIKNLTKKHYNPGHYQIEWNGRDNSGVEVPSGFYFYRMNTNYGNQTKRMLLIK